MALKLSKEEEYGVLALVDLAYNLGESRVRVKELARRQNIPSRFLEQIFSKLQRAGIVMGKRGPRGGYCLARDPGEIRLEEVLRALRPQTKEDTRTDKPALAEFVETVWSEFEETLNDSLKTISLTDMCTRARDLGITDSTGAPVATVAS